MKNDKLKHIFQNKDDLRQMRLTRRELLETGLMGFSAQAAIPGVVTSILSMSARAEAQQATPMVPFITLSLSGGAALHGNYIVKNQAGDLLGSGYTKLGLGSNGSLSTVKVMGADFGSTSQLHKGIQSVVSAGTIQKTFVVGLCTDTANDTNGQSASRPFYDLTGPLERAGLIGKILPSLHSGFGFENLRPVFGAPNTVMNISRLDNVFGALNYSGVLGSSTFTEAQKGVLSNFVARMTQSQVARLSTSSEGLKTVLAEAGVKSGEIIKAGATGVDPRTNGAAQMVYGLTPSTAVSNADAITAGVVFNAINGNISHGRITLGGYDYHSPGTRDVANQKDFDAGKQIGRMLELAAKMNSPLFLMVTTDGACSSAESTTSSSVWTNDYSSSVQLIFAFHPQGKFTSSGSQVGQYLDDQSVDTKTLVGSRPDYVAATILANYLNLNNKLGLFKQLAPATLQSDDVEKVVKLHIT
jgi:hypothetical protein